KWIGAAGDERPGASDQSLQDSEDEPRQSNGPEEKCEPNGDRGKHPLRKGRQRAGGERENDEQKRDRNQQPFGIAEVRDLVESFDQPQRKILRNVDGRGVEQEHGDHDCRSGGNHAATNVQRRASHRNGCRLGPSPEQREVASNILTQRVQIAGRSALLCWCGYAHDPSRERKTAIVTGWPVLKLRPSTRGPAV